MFKVGNNDMYFFVTMMQIYLFFLSLRFATISIFARSRQYYFFRMGLLIQKHENIYHGNLLKLIQWIMMNFFALFYCNCRRIN
jgi:hypothetical protein